CALSRLHRVTLAAPIGSVLPASERYQGVFTLYDPASWLSLAGSIAQSDVVFAYPDTLWFCRTLLGEFVAMIVDGYDLALLEHLELDAGRLSTAEQMAWQEQHQQISKFILQRGDLF